MLNKNSALALFGILSLYSCGSQTISSQYTSEGAKFFPSDEKLQEISTYKWQGVGISGLHLLNDSTLLIRNAPNQAESHFTVWNPKADQPIGNFLFSGRKENQAISFLSFGTWNSYIWVNDIVKEKFLLHKYNDTGKAQEYRMPTFFYSVQLLNSDTLIGGGDYESDHKVALVKLSTGEKLLQVAPYAKSGDNPIPREQKMAYESFLFIKPSGSKCVLAQRYSDAIEIIDWKNNSSQTILGPEGFEPELIVAVGNDGKKLSTRGSDTRYGYVKGKTTEKHIYLLYSGHNHNSEHLHYGNSLYVYNWNGKPIRKLNFPSDVIDFAVDSDENIVYAYHPFSKSLTTYKLNQ